MALARRSGSARRSAAAIAFFAGSWLLAQVLGHAGFPLPRLTLRGGRRRARPCRRGSPRGRRPRGLRAPPAARLGDAAADRPPLGRRARRADRARPRARRSSASRGAIVRGGIVITADDVTVRDVTVIGGEYGIDVEDAKNVVLERRHGRRRHARRHPRPPQRGARSRDCRSTRRPARIRQGIDISFAIDLADEHGRGLHDRRRPRGHRHALDERSTIAATASAGRRCAGSR